MISQKKITALSTEHPLEGVALRVISIALFALILLYLYLVSTSIFNVMGRTSFERQSAALQGTIGVLEQRYFSLSNQMTTETAGTLGLIPVESTSYVYRPGTAASLPITSDVI